MSQSYSAQAGVAMPAESPFALDNAGGYAAWRARKLSAYPLAQGSPIEVGDARELSAAARRQLMEACRRTNMAFYIADGEGREVVHQLARQMGLTRADGHLCADADGISTLQVSEEALKRGYIPYTDRPINWHTDGYYNAPEQTIRAMMLHCEHPAAEGGENACLDPEMLYIQLRDIEPRYVSALMQPGCMTIPANRDEEGELRPERSGPVFSLDARDHSLHLRYTARKRSISWQDDPLVIEARDCLESLLADENPFIVRRRLAAGEGLVCNNVLHRRSGFRNGDGGTGRVFYRARFYERIAGTGGVASIEK